MVFQPPTCSLSSRSDAAVPAISSSRNGTSLLSTMGCLPGVHQCCVCPYSQHRSAAATYALPHARRCADSWRSAALTLGSVGSVLSSSA